MTLGVGGSGGEPPLKARGFEGRRGPKDIASGGTTFGAVGPCRLDY